MWYLRGIQDAEEIADDLHTTTETVFSEWYGKTPTEEMTDYLHTNETDCVL
jgi:hypothetical protein